MVLPLILAGTAAGFLAGFFGVGGGVILVPILFHVLGGLGVSDDIRMHMAVATSLATIIVTSLRSVHRHASHGAVEGAVLKRWAGPVILGALTGTVFARGVEGPVLTLIFIVCALLMSAWLAFGRDEWSFQGRAREPWFSAQGLGIGFLSTLMGIGGGVFGVSLLTLQGVPIHRAIGTSSGLGLIIAIPAVIGFVWGGWGLAHLPDYSLGYIHLPGFAMIAPLTIAVVPYGVRAAHALDRRTLKRLFGAFLAIMALTLAADVT